MLEINSRKLRFSLPPRFKDEASVRSILTTFGAKLLNLDCSSKTDESVSGLCRFSTVEDAAVVGSSLHGLKIGDFNVEIEPVEETEEDLALDNAPISALAVKKAVKEKKPPARTLTPVEETPAAAQVQAPTRKKPGPKPKPKPVPVEKTERAEEEEEGVRGKKKQKLAAEAEAMVVEEKPKMRTKKPQVEEDTVVLVSEKKRPVGRPPKKVVASSSSEEEEEEDAKNKRKKMLPALKRGEPPAVPIPTIPTSDSPPPPTKSHQHESVDGEEQKEEEVSRSVESEELTKMSKLSRAPSTTATAEEDVWEEYLDERYKVPYYFNPATQETTWELPATASRIVKSTPSPTPAAAVAVSTAATAAAAPVSAASVPASGSGATMTAPLAASAAAVPAPAPALEEPVLERQHSSQSRMKNPVPVNYSEASGTSRMESRRYSTEVFRGTIANVKSDFGFINSPAHSNNRTDLFFHFDELVEPTSVFFPKKGDEVEFELSLNHNRGQLIAVRVRRAGRGGAAPSAAAAAAMPPLARSASQPLSSSSLPPPSRSSGSHGGSHHHGGGRRRSSRGNMPSRGGSRMRSRSPPPAGGGGGMLRRSVSNDYPSRGGGWGGSGHRDVAPPVQQQPQTWVRYVDRKSNLPYWHCPATNETTWTNPE